MGKYVLNIRVNSQGQSYKELTPVHRLPSFVVGAAETVFAVCNNIELFLAWLMETLALTRTRTSTHTLSETHRHPSLGIWSSLYQK